jgi:hypothetical protein
MGISLTLIRFLYGFGTTRDLRRPVCMHNLLGLQSQLRKHSMPSRWQRVQQTSPPLCIRGHPTTHTHSHTNRVCLWVQLLPWCSRGDVADSFAPGLSAEVSAVLMLVGIFLRPLAAGCRGLARRGREALATVLLAASCLGVLVLVLVLWQCCSIE